MYINNFSFPQSSKHSGSIDLLDDETYSTMTSATTSSVFTPRSSTMAGVNSQGQSMKFAIPPDLQLSSSSESSSVEERQIVPYYAPPPKSLRARSESMFDAGSCTTLSSVEEHRMIRVPRSNNPFGADAIHPKKKTMKKRRKQNTAIGTASGMVVGGLVLGPLGVFVGGAVGGEATRQICKARERHAQRKYEQKNFQHQARRSAVYRGECSFA